MILVKTRHKIYDSKLLAIIKAFKTWQYYLEDCEYNVFVLINFNNLFQFINIKSLSLQQI